MLLTGFFWFSKKGALEAPALQKQCRTARHRWRVNLVKEARTKGTATVST